MLKKATTGKKTWADDYSSVIEYLRGERHDLNASFTQGFFDDFTGYEGNYKPLATFESTEAWFNSGVADTANFKEGRQGRKLTSTNLGAVFSELSVNIDSTKFNSGDAISDYDLISIWVYVDNVANLNSAYCYIQSGSTFLTNFIRWSLHGNLVNGWNYVTRRINQTTETGGTINRANITRLTVAAVANSGVTVNVTFDDWQIIRNVGATAIKVDEDRAYTVSGTGPYTITMTTNPNWSVAPGAESDITNFFGYNRWKDFKWLDSNGAMYSITASTQNTLTVTSDQGATPSNGTSKGIWLNVWQSRNTSGSVVISKDVLNTNSLAINDIGAILYSLPFKVADFSATIWFQTKALVELQWRFRYPSKTTIDQGYMARTTNGHNWAIFKDTTSLVSESYSSFQNNRTYCLRITAIGKTLKAELSEDGVNFNRKVLVATDSKYSNGFIGVQIGNGGILRILRWELTNMQLSFSNPPREGTIILPATSFLPDNIAPCEMLRINDVSEFVDSYVLAYDPINIEFASCELAIPNSYRGGQISFDIYWRTSGTSGNAVWSIIGIWLISGDSYSKVSDWFGSAAVTAAPSTANNITKSTVVWDGSTAIPLPYPGSILRFRLTREVNHFSDTLTQDALVERVVVRFAV